MFENVAVYGGERTELSFEYVSGTLSIGTQRGETLVDSVVSIFDDAGKKVDGGRTYVSEKSNPMPSIVTPGKYSIQVAEIGGDKRTFNADVVAGETTTTIVDFDQAGQ